MDYKRFIKNQEIRFKLLHLLRFIPDREMIEFEYRIKLGRRPNLKEPKRYSEKLQWYKLNYRIPLMTQCADKYKVRKYIESKGLGNILTRLYAVYDSVEDIDFNSLPEKFIMKTNNGSGTNYFCKDKSKLPLGDVMRCFNNWMKRDIYSSGREWAYKGIISRIIVEEYLEDESNPFNGINDYKFMCFNGRVKYIILDVNRHTDHKRNIYDVNWNYIDVSTDHPNMGDCVPKPEGLNEMLRVVNIIAKDFPFVRVDLYWVNKRVYFGEITFYPWTGYVKFIPDDFDIVLGNNFMLPRKQLS